MGNIGHFDNESKFDKLESSPGVKVVTSNHKSTVFVPPDGHSVSILDPITALQVCMEGVQVDEHESVVGEIGTLTTTTGNFKIIILERYICGQHRSFRQRE